MPRFCQARPVRPRGMESRAASRKPQWEFSQAPMRKPTWLMRMNGSQSCSTGNQRSRVGMADLPAFRRW
ncbi:hypothetical protein D3C81_1817010 [compost metagenome]